MAREQRRLPAPCSRIGVSARFMYREHTQGTLPMDDFLRKAARCFAAVRQRYQEGTAVCQSRDD